MQPRHVRLLPLAALVVAVVALAGCGGGGKKAATTTTTAATSTAAAPGLSVLATIATCPKLSGLVTGLEQAMSGAAPSNVAGRARILERYAAKAPAAVRGDLEVVAQAFANELGNVKLGSSAGGPSASALIKLEQLATKITSPKVRAAEAAIGTWAAANCQG